jgi:hypothetical protein
MTKRIFLLEGGMVSIDGILTSIGMDEIVVRLRNLPNTDIHTYLWADYKKCFLDQNRLCQPGDYMVLIGYSGGAAMATRVANMMARFKETVDLMVLYDPSPQTWMQAIQSNVKKALVFQNKLRTIVAYPGIPPWVWVGGGKLESTGSTEIEVHPIRENHLQVQFDNALHAITNQRVAAL